MIQVRTSGVNSFTLKGNCLYDGGVEFSSISVHADGWSVDLLFNEGRGRECEEGLERDDVLRALREMLMMWGCDEEPIDEDEILEYMQHVRQIR